jgi:aminoglycoside phosphotransferase (APT) family kinase protein
MTKDPNEVSASATAGGGVDLDLPKLAAFLRSSLGAPPGELGARRFRGGQSNPTYLLSVGKARYVLRKKPSGSLLRSAHAVEREYRVMSALANSAVPVPKMVCLCEDPDVLGTPFYIMEFIEGRVLYDPTLPGMSREERATAYTEMSRVISALHQVDYRSLGLESFGHPGRYLERQIGRWTKQYRASETEPIEVMERLIEWLPAHIPAAEDSAVVHGDFRLDNLILSPTEPRILAVVDWELSTLGDPLADFSYHALMWNLTKEQFRGMAGRELAALGIPTEGEYVAEYCRRTGRAPIDSRVWDFYIAFNLFRLAAILQGILKRSLEGNATDPTAPETGRRARAIAEAGWQRVTSSRLD